jgi:deoxyribodipyrimidine photo-lyase
MNITFPTSFAEIIHRVNQIDPIAYGKSRNYLNGAVTYLSPYIARGVISLPYIKECILTKHSKASAEKFLQELAWREYFQRVWQAEGRQMFADLKQIQTNVTNRQIPEAIVNGCTTIQGIDQSIEQLLISGYMHNHARMYTAMLACNIGQSHWLEPAKWMYYHLLDGDLASNMLSWQWVCGTFSHKKYYANQENINRYCATKQEDSFLQYSYEELPTMPTPNILLKTVKPALNTQLPENEVFNVDTSLPLLLYNTYQLDPNWYAGIQANRILVLEPRHFSQFPVSEKVLSFIIRLAKDNIPDIKIYVGEVGDLPDFANCQRIYYKEHPTALYYPGIAESRDWLFPQVMGPNNSFFGFWKKCQKYL